MILGIQTIRLAQSKIIKLSQFLKKFNFENIFIFYPSLRHYLASKIARIKNIYHYPLFIKKNLHLVDTAKKFTENLLTLTTAPQKLKSFLIPQRLKNTNLTTSKRLFLELDHQGLPQSGAMIIMHH